MRPSLSGKSIKVIKVRIANLGKNFLIIIDGAELDTSFWRKVAQAENYDFDPSYIKATYIGRNTFTLHLKLGHYLYINIGDFPYLQDEGIFWD